VRGKKRHWVNLGLCLIRQISGSDRELVSRKGQCQPDDLATKNEQIGLFCGGLPQNFTFGLESGRGAGHYLAF
jgi:hypothetical protein